MSEKMVMLFKGLVENKPMRFLLRASTHYCEKDRAPAIKAALEKWVGLRKSICGSCLLTQLFASAVIKMGARAFGASSEEVREKLHDRYWVNAFTNVLTGLAEFGVHKPFVPGAPFLVVWDITYACNLRCKHCYASASQSLPDELTTEEAKQVIDELVSIGVPIIAFSGGEPLVRKDILQLCRYASRAGMYVAIATNGTLLTSRMVSALKEAGVQFLQISLDGASPKTHDSFRGIEGAFQATIEGIKRAVEAGFFVNIATTVTHYNYEEVPEIISLAEKLGVDWFMVYNFVPVGRGREIVSTDMTPDEREALLETLWSTLSHQKSKVNVLTTAPQYARVALQNQLKAESGEKIVPTHFYNPKLSDRLVKLAEFIGGCGAGRFYFAIKPNGDIHPCVFFPLKVGNALEDDIEELWLKNSVFRDLRDKDKLKGNCGKCEFRYVCGGCRARAYNYTGDYLSPDPGCIKNAELFWELRGGS